MKGAWVGAQQQMHQWPVWMLRSMRTACLNKPQGSAQCFASPAMKGGNIALACTCGRTHLGLEYEKVPSRPRGREGVCAFLASSAERAAASAAVCSSSRRLDLKLNDDPEP